MSGADRLRQLRELVGRLELLPVTEERDRLLRKARARAVDVDTGVTRPLDVASVAPSRRRRSLPSRGGAPPVRDAVAKPASSDVLAAGRRLCLDDLDAHDAPRPEARGAWTRGLRG